MKLRLDARPVPPVEFELTTSGGSVEVFHLRPFSVADEQFLSGIEGAFQTPLACLPVVLRQLLDNEEVGRFSAAFGCAAPGDVTPAAYMERAAELAEVMPQAVMTALATRILVFRQADSDKLQGVIPEKKPVGGGWLTRILFFCAGLSVGALAMSCLSLFGIL